MHFYQFNISDYKSHTEHLDPMEDLAYRRLLDWCYLHEKPLPKNKGDIARFIRMRTHSECIANVLREFFTVNKDGEFIHKRVFLEIDRANAKSTKARNSAKARWDKVSSSANALRTDSECNATQDTRHITQDPLPSWVNQEAWGEFIQHRKDIRKPLTGLAKKKNLKILEQNKNMQQEIIDKSIANRWSGLFPVKINNFQNEKPADDYSHYRKLGAEIDIHPNGSESNKDYIARVKNVLN